MNEETYPAEEVATLMRLMASQGITAAELTDALAEIAPAAYRAWYEACLAAAEFRALIATGKVENQR